MLLFSSVLLEDNIVILQCRAAYAASEIEYELNILHIYTSYVIKTVYKLFIRLNSVSLCTIVNIVIAFLDKFDGNARMIF